MRVTCVATAPQDDGMTPAPAGYRIVEVPEPRKDELLEVDHLAFAFEPDAETSAQVPMTLEWDRTVGVEAPDGRLAAVHGSFRFVLPVPGGTVPCAGLTWVGTRPDQRRRGLLSAMVDAHFARSLARDEPVSALYAAEPGIYGRFGYGSAAQNVRMTVPRGAALRPVVGSQALAVRFERLDPDVHGPLVQRVHAAAGAGRPGWITRDTDALRRRHLADPPAWREGAEPLRVVTVLGGEEPRGYALLRRKEVWTDGQPSMVVRVQDVAALDAAAAHRIWSVLLDLDLSSAVETPMLAADDVLLQLLVDPRGPRPRLVDNLWLRVLDVRAALAARRWSAPVDVVLDVQDARLPANAARWRVTTGEPGADGTWDARVEPTRDPADVALDVRELGAVYLGGRSLGALGQAGLVTERVPGTLHRASAAFGWPLAPLCSWQF